MSAGGTEIVAESDFHNGHAVLETGGIGKLSREKMVYMAVKDPSQEDSEISESPELPALPPIPYTHQIICLSYSFCPNKWL